MTAPRWTKAAPKTNGWWFVRPLGDTETSGIPALIQYSHSDCVLTIDGEQWSKWPDSELEHWSARIEEPPR
jgi:hypothetical protein